MELAIFIGVILWVVFSQIVLELIGAYDGPEDKK